jgi:putative membrane protein
MKRTVQGILLAGSLVLGGGALAQGSAQGQAQRADKSMAGGADKAQGGAQMGATKGQKGMAEYMGVMVPTDPKAFLERMHMVNQMEIKLGQLAETNSQNEDVKALGREGVRALHGAGPHPAGPEADGLRQEQGPEGRREAHAHG